MRRILELLIDEHTASHTFHYSLLLRDLNELAAAGTSKVLMSGCLMGQRVSYRGGSSNPKPTHPIHFIRNVLCVPNTIRLNGAPFISLVPYCPEVQLLGMAVPRPPIRLWGKDRKVIRSDNMEPVRTSFEADDLLIKSIRNVCTECKGFILKSRSPSCGVGDARVYERAMGGEYSLTDGFFVREVIQPAQPNPNLVTERSLKDKVALVNFLELVLS